LLFSCVYTDNFKTILAVENTIDIRHIMDTTELLYLMKNFSI
jgi:hypothetical protein